MVNTNAEDDTGKAKCQPVLEDYYECLHHRKEVCARPQNSHQHHSKGREISNPTTNLTSSLGSTPFPPATLSDRKEHRCPRPRSQANLAPSVSACAETGRQNARTPSRLPQSAGRPPARRRAERGPDTQSGPAGQPRRRSEREGGEVHPYHEEGPWAVEGGERESIALASGPRVDMCARVCTGGAEGGEGKRCVARGEEGVRITPVVRQGLTAATASFRTWDGIRRAARMFSREEPKRGLAMKEEEEAVAFPAASRARADRLHYSSRMCLSHNPVVPKRPSRFPRRSEYIVGPVHGRG